MEPDELAVHFFGFIKSSCDGKTDGCAKTAMDRMASREQSSFMYPPCINVVGCYWLSDGGDAVVTSYY